MVSERLPLRKGFFRSIQRYIMEQKSITKIILGVLLTLGSIYLAYRNPSTVTYADGISKDVTAEYSIPAMVDYYAEKYKVDPKLANYIAKHESSYNPNEVGDLGITCREKGSNYGKPVYARGIFQITRCYYPGISDDQAFDPTFNIEYAMTIISKGKRECMSQFSTCRAYYS